jgi:short-subunit dehydrogenase
VNLVLVARDQEKLSRIAGELQSPGVSVRTVGADLSRAVSPSEILDATRAANINVDFLVNNAGFGASSFFADSDLQADLDMMQVNMVSLVHLTRLYLPGMRQRGVGGILNVASTAAFQPGPLMALYYASKAFVLSFTEAIAEELRGTALTATALCPGPTATDFQRRAKIEGIRLMKSKAIAMMTASEVAEIGYRGFLAGKAVIIPGVLNKFAIQLLRVSPRALVPRITRKLQES